MKLFKCNICGNMVELIENGGGELVCCNEPMEELAIKETDLGLEKHVPVANYEQGKLIVNVGSTAHPMTKEHYIMMIFIVINNKIIRQTLAWDSLPTAEFLIPEDANEIEMYAYCNVHGLWKGKYIKTN